MMPLNCGFIFLQMKNYFFRYILLPLKACQFCSLSRYKWKILKPEDTLAVCLDSPSLNCSYKTLNINYFVTFLCERIRTSEVYSKHVLRYQDTFMNKILTLNSSISVSLVVSINERELFSKASEDKKTFSDVWAEQEGRKENCQYCQHCNSAYKLSQGTRYQPQCELYSSLQIQGRSQTV